MANKTHYYPTTTGTYPTDYDKIVTIDTAQIEVPARVAYHIEDRGVTYDVQCYTTEALAAMYAAKCAEHGTRNVTVTP